jgi:hypothetical protein
VGIPFALLGGVELAIRWIDPEEVETRELEASPYDFHPRYLLGLKPLFEASDERSPANGGGTIQWRTNRYGFRGEPLEDDPAARIIVYGDSNIQAPFSRLERTFVYQLEERLRALTGREIEVVNAGVSGFGPDQSLLRFSGEVHLRRPDAVVLHVFADNDFGDLIRNRLFELSPGGDLVETPHPRDIDPLLEGIGRGRSLRSRLASLRIARAANDLRDRAVALLGSSEEDAYGPGRRSPLLRDADREYLVYTRSEPKRFCVFCDHYDYDLALLPQSESARTKRALMAEILKRARRLASSRDIGFMVLIQPSSRDLTRNASPNYEHLQAFSGYRRTNLSAFVADICDENGIAYVNLFDAFARQNPESLFFVSDDDHWNDAGQALAAAEAASLLHEEVLVR